MFHSDVAPRYRDTISFTFLGTTKADVEELGVKVIITNPPYSQKKESGLSIAAPLSGLPRLLTVPSGDDKTGKVLA